MFKKVYVLILIKLFLSNVSLSQTFYKNTEYNHQVKWVDSVFNSLSTEQRLGQLFMVAAYSDKDQKHVDDIELLISKYNIGGLIFFQGGPGRQAHLTNRYQQISQTPLLIGMDAEWGLAMRLDSILPFPKQMTLGAINDEHLIYEMGVEVAKQCKTLGVHVNFAPVADINSNPANPVIGMRSFGENKEKVAAKARAYMRGLKDNGIIASAKHFPGHGDTDKDSHLALPLVTRSITELQATELHPFKELIKDSLMSLMVGHIQVPAIDPTPGKAASLSSPTIKTLLRKEMKFEGLIFTDALNMRGVTTQLKPGEVDLAALIAGNDVLLFSENVPHAIGLIKQAVKRKLITQKDLDEKIKKILMAKYWAGLSRPQEVITDNLLLKLNSPEANVLVRKLYESSISVVRNEARHIPYRMLDTTNFASISIGSSQPTIFQEVLSNYTMVSHFQLNDKTPARQYATLLNDLKRYKLIIVGLHNLRNERDNNYGIAPASMDFLNALQKQNQVILVVFGNPYSLKNFDNFQNVICAYEDNDITESIASQLIFGAVVAKGTLPVTASSKYTEGLGEQTKSLRRLAYSIPEQVGMDSDILANIDEVFSEVINNRAAPGGQVLVARNGKVIFNKSYGHQAYDMERSVNSQTIYDVASVTKVAGTLQTIMFLQERDLINVENRLSYYLPDLKKTELKNIRINDILTHQAGLTPFVPFWKRTVDEFGLKPDYYRIAPNDTFSLEVVPGLYTLSAMPDTIWQWVVKTPLMTKPRKKENYEYKYSDFGFIMMKQLAEHLINQPIDEFMDQNFFSPIGMYKTSYKPLCKFPENEIAPTENDTLFRRNLLSGSVHDQTAALYGGVAGHAGLFSTANDLAKLMQMNLQNGYYGGIQYLQPETVGFFAKKQFKDNRRGLGWDKPAMGEISGPTCRFSSENTFGHTGFTGTAVWVDPEFDLVYIFISNRVYPNANNAKLIQTNIRTRIQEIIYQSMWSFEKTHIDW